MGINDNSRIPLVDLKAQYMSICDEVRASIQDVLNSAHFVGGEFVERFEQQFANYVGARYAIGVSSGTAALELALKATGIGAGDEVIVPANTFFATAEAVSNVGATPVFADVQPATFHLDPAWVESALTPHTRAIIPVHLYGQAMDLRAIEEIASANQLAIIEDAAQAHGAELNGKKVGGSARPTCFSFYPGKNLGAYGDAGAVTCDDAEFAAKLRLLRDHGSPRKYEHALVGTNARLDAIQAAVLSVKLPYLDIWNEARRRHARTYVTALTDSFVCPPAISSKNEHVWHLFVIRTRQRDELRQHLAARGIETGIHYPVPLHLTSAYRAINQARSSSIPVAESLADEIMSLPMYPELTEEQLEHIVDSVLHLRGSNIPVLPVEHAA